LSGKLYVVPGLFLARGALIVAHLCHFVGR
jgi:hypothetical protein